MRPLRLAALVAPILGCQTPTDAGASKLVVKGVWNYTAAQTAGGQAGLTGTLTVSTQSGTSFSGSASATQTDASNVTTQLAGPLSGKAVDSVTVDFDVFFDANGRRHVATVIRDSMKGSWVEDNGDGTASGGTFVAVRTSGP
ncbi:MAG TPA: hypothetical protein VMC86_11940 [Gemmatimonadales bacterium]|nr:hypothetical protein [Gemmatimonadales bacterium]